MNDRTDFWYPLITEFDHLNGWLINILPTTVRPEDSDTDFSAVILYFMRSDGSTFRINKIFEPYFYVMMPYDKITDYNDHKQVRRIEYVQKLDIGTLEGTRTAAKLIFATVKDLVKVRGELSRTKAELRECDVQYYERFCIDNNIRVGRWYNIDNIDGNPHISLEAKEDDQERPGPTPRILAFDIECSKQPLQFPNTETDQIMMISYMLDGTGYLVINREWFSEEIESFEYSPLQEYFCEFHVTNFPNEREMLKGWFNHIREVKPHIFVTFNGDFFDWEFIQERARILNLSMYDEIGFSKFNDQFVSNYAPHIDCFHWVQRDSYLPAGSQGLKAVTKAKLNYNPLELDPEDICPLGMEDPQRLANYSVSDAYATYYLYEKFIHGFIFSLSTIIPLNPDDCLRRGTGTLCESLLMSEAYKCNIFFPNKTTNDEMKEHEGHVLISETYSGGRVETIESGIFRDDIPTEFNVNPEQYQDIINRVPRIFNFVLNTELRIKEEDIANYEEVKHNIISALEDLRDNPHRCVSPIIMHLDVAAMYPNIILTNRLQPTAIVTEDFCSKCTMRGDKCQRKMQWIWRGEWFPSTAKENSAIIKQLETETHNGESWYKLSTQDQAKIFKQRLNHFCKKHYQKPKIEKEITKTSIICMKANDFYIETVRAFRDRRYVYKDKVKFFNKKLQLAKTPAEKEYSKKMITLNDSLQLAHKAILNSFYGYVMRAAARWRSMEMAGVVTNTGATIIKQTRAIITGLGRPLELDTDGIWCALPDTFPMKQTFIMKNGDQKAFNFPCSMLNENVDNGFSNHQYHTLVQKGATLADDVYRVHKENSIFFEPDGPYHAMFLPAAREEGKKLKKRYAVFDKNGKIHELKGFEIKRRGEWKMIKMLQKDVFDSYMYGHTRQEVYDHVADVCRQYLSVLTTHGRTIDDNELLDLLSESSTMSKSLTEYGDRKSTASTTAKRLAEVLGDSILNSRSLKCEYIISRLPASASVALRSIPVIIFHDSVDNIVSYLQRWCEDSNIKSPDFRDIVDWDYYTQRFYGAIQKILVIPSLLQGIKLNNFNVPPPDWVIRKQKEEALQKGQTKIDFTSAPIARQKIERPKFQRDTSNLTEYQLALIEAKKKWRATRTSIAASVAPQRNFQEWRVVEIRKSSEPGKVNVFVQTSAKMLRKLEVSVPRIFYINSTKQSAEFFQRELKDKVKVVKKHLPHGFKPEVITQFTLTEEEFLEHKAEFSSSFNTAGIKGVYETQVTPLFRALCSIKNSVIASKKNTLKLNDLKEPKRIMLPELYSLNRIYIYSCYSHGRGLLALVNIPANAKTAEAQVFVFSKRNVEISAPSLHPFQNAALNDLEDKTGVVTLTKYIVKTFTKIHYASKALHEAILKIGESDNTIVYLQSHLNFEQLVGALGVVSLHQYPIVTLDFLHSDDNLESSAEDTEHMQWHDYAFKHFTTRFIQLNSSIQQKLDYSALLQTPLGNITEDYCMGALDLLFARELINRDYIMWYSESAEPDIGGSYSNQLITMPGDPHKMLMVNRPGTYLSHCVDIRVVYLGVSAVIEGQALFDRFLPSHQAPSSSDFSVNPQADALSVTEAVFQLLSIFLTNIIKKCGDEKNILSQMSAQIGTWLCNSQSVFYDPAIHSVYQLLLNTVFNELVSKFEEQHIPVVYADHSRILVNNGEFPLMSAIDAINKNQLTSRVDFLPITTYEKLVWIDPYNHQTITAEGDDVFEWNISNLINETLRKELENFFKKLLRSDNIYSFFTSEANEILYKFGQLMKVENNFNTVFQHPLRTPKDITRSDALVIINTIFHALDNLNSENAGVPVPDGKGDSYLRNLILNSRRQVLLIHGISDHDPRTRFVDPALHLYIPSVLCKHCLHTTNIDILRDKECLKGNFMCPICKAVYDTEIIERWIFEEVSRKVEQYQLQDLACAKKHVAHRKMPQSCKDDGGILDVTVSKQDINEYLQTVITAAKEIGLDKLGETISYILEYTK